MKEFAVLFTKRAKKELSKLDVSVQKVIVAWIAKNIKGTTEPRKQGKALKGDKKGYWRYRVGNYRIIADIRDEELVVVAVSIAHRNSVYDDF